MRKTTSIERLKFQLEGREPLLGQEVYPTPSPGTYWAEIVPLKKIVVPPEEVPPPPKPMTIGERIAAIIESVRGIFKPPEKVIGPPRPEITETIGTKVARIIETAKGEY